jgi:hypothetical protein
MPVIRRINKTPLRDLLRGRITGRLDWEADLDAAGLPPAASELIGRVVKRTRLFRAEKVAVASELIAHFLDGLAAGSTAAELVERFGDERVAARLIRRAKRRGRSVAWHVWSVGIRLLSILLGFYAILLVRFYVGRPSPSVDYVVKLNEPTLRMPESDRAWPLWRQAILASSDGSTKNELVFAEAIAPHQEDRPWPETVQWLNGHASAVELARAAGRKPIMGFILGAGGSADDPPLFFSAAGRQRPGEPLTTVALPYLNDMFLMANVLSLDSRHGAEKGDGAIAEADLLSMLGLARQLRESNGFLWTQFVALSVNSQLLRRLRSLLINNASAFKDEQWVRLAHSISGPNVASDLLSLKAERYGFDDVVQRLYTDNGHGDGHITLRGLRLHMLSWNDGDPLNLEVVLEAASTVPGLAASRAEVIRASDQLMDEGEANLHRPIRETDVHQIETQIRAWKNSPVGRFRYAVVCRLIPNPGNTQQNCERYLGERDGTMVGIALELYRRRHGSYPKALTELTPEYLPQIPADRITGDPVKYRLIDGKPVVYSVGADRVDDGGVSPDRISQKTHSSAAGWGIDPTSAPRGDWILFAAGSANGANN